MQSLANLRQLRRALLGTFGSFVLYIAFGALFFSFAEGWSYGNCTLGLERLRVAPQCPTVPRP